MAEGEEVKLDRIGNWSEKKLEIVEKYAKAYSSILRAKRQSWSYPIYIDAFAGHGSNVLRDTGDIVDGSPLIMLKVEPPFQEYHFIEIKPDRISVLRDEVKKHVGGETKEVFLYEGDCNKVLQEEVFRRVSSEDNIRALCFLDPKGLHFSWETVCAAAGTGKIDLFLNFSIFDANKNGFIRDLAELKTWQIERMDEFWGDRTWLDVATAGGLFEDAMLKTVTNAEIAAAYRLRLRDVAGFEYVTEPFPMRNDKGSIIYYLYLASHVPVADKIATDIFRKAFKERHNVQPFRHRVDRNDVEPGNGLF